MSAFLAVRQKDRVHLIVDGAWFAPDGRLAGVGSKIIELPQASAAITLRGHLLVGGDVRQQFSHFASFDLLVAAAPKIVAGLQDKWRDQTIYQWEILIVGISETRGPEIYFAPPDGELQLIDGEDFAAGPQPSPATFLAAGLKPPESMADFDPVEHGVPVMEAFRRTLGPMGGVPQDVHGVGGFVSHTLIKADQIESDIIHVWPDVIGEKIDPSRGGAAPVSLLQLSAM